MKKSACSKIHKVVFVRHGESTWNKENRFTGWTDVALTENGIQEAKFAGQLLKQNGFNFDLAFTSVLTRAIMTYNNIATELGCHWIPVHKHWRLNERHYGALQGLNKAETAAKHGEEQVTLWRRSYDIPPPELALDDERHPQHDPRYQGLPLDVLPKTESLKITVDRVLPFWYDKICPEVLSGKNVIVVAHGNSLRAIVKHLSQMSDTDIIKYNIPTACPLVYEFDETLKPIKNYYLLDEKTLKERMEAVANQAKAKH
jgi:2,3-bisphosphoglycerate-dependent phosphoglycerate mutase